MRNLTRTFFALTLMFAGLTCEGQTSARAKQKAAKTRTRPKPRAEEETPLPTLQLPKGVTAPGPEWTREVGAVAVSYYRGRDETVVSTGSEIYHEPPVSIRLIYDFRVKGEGLVRPPAVTVTAVANAAVFNENAGVIIEADGVRFNFKPDTQGCIHHKCTNAVAAVDFATFVRIADSGKVVVHAPPYTFTLSEQPLVAARDVVRAVETGPKRP